MPAGLPVPKAKRRILVVDDERVISDTMAVILNQAGFEARAVLSGKNAIKTLESFTPDVLLCDVIMPEMNGIELALKMRHLVPGCRILLFSGQAATSTLLEEAKAQGHEFEILAKPIHPSELLQKLRNKDEATAI
jgi:DNA-binding NtrC family response regulator